MQHPPHLQALPRICQPLLERSFPLLLHDRGIRQLHLQLHHLLLCLVPLRHGGSCQHLLCLHLLLQGLQTSC